MLLQGWVPSYFAELATGICARRRGKKKPTTSKPQTLDPRPQTHFFETQNPPNPQTLNPQTLNPQSPQKESSRGPLEASIDWSAICSSSVRKESGTFSFWGFRV